MNIFSKKLALKLLILAAVFFSIEHKVSAESLCSVIAKIVMKGDIPEDSVNMLLNTQVISAETMPSKLNVPPKLICMENLIDGQVIYLKVGKNLKFNVRAGQKVKYVINLEGSRGNIYTAQPTPDTPDLVLISDWGELPVDNPAYRLYNWLKNTWSEIRTYINRSF